jgi:ATP-binding cassette subfamily B protein
VARGPVVVLDHGRVAEEGTHAELLAREGLYARCIGGQFAEVG